MKNRAAVSTPLVVENRRSPAPARAATVLHVGMLALVASLALLGLDHLLNAGQMPRHVSNFVELPYRWLWDVSLLAYAVGLFCTAFGLRAALPRHRDAVAATHAMAMAGGVALLLYLFPTDPTPLPQTFSGWTHDLSAVSIVVLQGSAVLLGVDAARGNAGAGWAQAFGTSWRWPTTTVALGFAWGIGDLTPYWPASAVLQRLVIASFGLYFARAAWNAKRAVAGLGMAAAHGQTAAP